MLITIKTDSGVKITQPEEKWLMALLITLSESDPALFAKVCDMVDNKVHAFATIPDSVQKAVGVGLPRGEY